MADSNNRKAKTRPISMFGFRTVTGSPTHKPSVSNNSRGKASSSPRAPPAPAAALAEEGKGSTRVTRPRGGVCWPVAARDRAEGSAGQRQHAAARRRRCKATAARHGAGRRQHAAARRRRRKAAARSRRSARPAGIRSAAPPRSARPAGRRPPRRAPAFPPCSGVPSTRRCSSPAPERSKIRRVPPSAGPPGDLRCANRRRTFACSFARNANWVRRLRRLLEAVSLTQMHCAEPILHLRREMATLLESVSFDAPLA